jgi:hypothetical protein
MLNRRGFLKGVGAIALSSGSGFAAPAPLRLGTFRFDVTPPAGHPLCGGWIKPVVDCEDALEAIGYVLLGAGAPIVVCAVDWTGIQNRAHVAWRNALAEAAGTTAERVAVQCVHQHDAPFVCLDAEKLLEQQHAGLTNISVEFFKDCLSRGREAVRDAVTNARPVTHVAHGEAPVERVASNRRVLRSPEGRVLKMRGSGCNDPELIALPEGLVDPLLKTVAFYDGPTRIAACHYYATHPMSHYGQGHVSSDFVGLARKRRQKDEPGCAQIYFTGCAGNIAAGKYNDGTPAARIQLTDRVYAGLIAADETLKPMPLTAAAWKTHEVLPEPNPVFTLEKLREMLANEKNVPANRIRPAMTLSWIDRVAQRVPIVLSALELNDVSILHLPAECFVEYQLRAQKLGAGRFIATAAYGDGGPWYIPVKEEYPNGGYEVSVAHGADTTDALLTEGMTRLLARD